MRRSATMTAALAISLIGRTDDGPVTAMSDTGQWRQPLCTRSVTVHSWENRKLISDAPALVKLADGTLLCSVELWSYDGFRKDRDALAEEVVGSKRCMVFASTDNGGTWAERSRAPFATGKFLQHDSGLLFVGSGTEWEGLYVTRSTDDGRTWSDAVQLRQGKVYAAATGWAIRGNTLYWAADDMHRAVKERAVFAFACDLRKDPLDPTSWRFSNDERHPGLPQSLGRGSHNGGKWLEPNVVEVNGKLLVIVRVRASQGQVDGVVPGIGAVCDLTDGDDGLRLRFSHYYPIPGAQNQFHIVRDEKAGLFWMTSNQVTGMAEGCYRGWGKERRFLMLHYSRDAQNWFPAGVLAMWPKETQAYNYCTPLVDGDDLLFVSRTAENATNQHDNDKITFHRLPDFRQTAVDLMPATEEEYRVARYVVGDIERTVIAARPGRYYGRCAVAELPGTPPVWVLFYHEASHHWKCTDGVMHVRFSDDYGESWSEEDTYLDGSGIDAFPAWPPGAEPDSRDYPGEPWAYVAPNGDVVLHTLNRRSAPSAFNGTWQIRSRDGGKTWSEWSQIDFKGVADKRCVLAIEDDIVVDGVVYQSAKHLSSHRGKLVPSHNILVRSRDNGLTWEKVSGITTRSENTNECGIEFLGNDTIIAHAVALTYKDNVQRISHDMGATWTDKQMPTYGTPDSVVSMHRQRLKTAAHIRGEPNWWDDPVLVVATNANIFHHGRKPRRRRNGVFISPDRGKTWQLPQWLDEETEDAGYGDTAWDPVKGKYAAWLYHGTNGEAVLKQYKFTIDPSLEKRQDGR